MKFVHISDTHLGCQIPIQYNELRKKDFLKTFKEAIEFSINNKVDFIIHSGDFFDDYFRFDSKFIIEVLDILMKLKNNNIPLIFIKGNHDVKGHRQNVLELFKKLDLIKEANIREPYIIKDVYIYGVSEPSNLAGEQLNKYYRELFSNINLENNGFRIFLFHGAVNMFPNNILEGYGKEPRILPLNIFPKADYYGFGHFHKSHLEVHDDIIFSLPGSTERTSLSKDEENIKKGFYYYSDNIDFIEVNSRPIYIYEDIINNEEDLNRLKDYIGKRSKETLIKLKLKYNKDLYISIKNYIDKLISSGYYIIDDLYSMNQEYNIIKDESNINDLFDNNIFVNNKEELLELFNNIKSTFEEFYSNKSSDIDRIRDILYKNLIK
ncbi:DNA double-strand break repair protein Mre11 [Nanobdella aerobiophila]|uniref:DNA double-strand break repair protein Mre11 n=1 Tax=Nanobdella aerobiophila TaxID=2586965 RepID=A0A915WS14_9ARCH|nr:metallophosphoesterase [Nanobdella aerobiophila]BBL45416.1 DNA double-strand break repair protein Mre11 [Nanobdella aerobiophila]